QLLHIGQSVAGEAGIEPGHEASDRDSVRPICRMRRPVRPHIGADQAAGRAHHPRTKGAYRQLVRQGVSVHHGAVIAPNRFAIDQQVATAVAADLTERYGGKCLALSGGHDAQSSMLATSRLPDRLTCVKARAPRSHCWEAERFSMEKTMTRLLLAVLLLT